MAARASYPQRADVETLRGCELIVYPYKNQLTARTQRFYYMPSIALGQGVEHFTLKLTPQGIRCCRSYSRQTANAEGTWNVAEDSLICLRLLLVYLFETSLTMQLWPPAHHIDHSGLWFAAIFPCLHSECWDHRCVLPLPTRTQS